MFMVYSPLRFVWLKTTNPRKGTETEQSVHIVSLDRLKTTNPRKGTETKSLEVYQPCRLPLKTTNPRKGTETQVGNTAQSTLKTLKTTNPRKGTEKKQYIPV